MPHTRKWVVLGCFMSVSIGFVCSTVCLLNYSVRIIGEWPERGYCRGSPQGMKAARGLVGVKKLLSLRASASQPTCEVAAGVARELSGPARPSRVAATFHLRESGAGESCSW